MRVWSVVIWWCSLGNSLDIAQLADTFITNRRDLHGVSIATEWSHPQPVVSKSIQLPSCCTLDFLCPPSPAVLPPPLVMWVVLSSKGSSVLTGILTYSWGLSVTWLVHSIPCLGVCLSQVWSHLSSMLFGLSETRLLVVETHNTTDWSEIGRVRVSLSSSLYSRQGDSRHSHTNNSQPIQHYIATPVTTLADRNIS